MYTLNLNLLLLPARSATIKKYTARDIMIKTCWQGIGMLQRLLLIATKDAINAPNF